MKNLLTDIEGLLVGHYTDAEALTGCTVILCPPHTIASCDVRGNSPGSRELALLAPDKQMQEIHAILLTGGSAFGLGAANGVMKFLSERGIGYQTPWAIIPIVPSAVIFDLNVGSSKIFPIPENAYDACKKASADFELGGVGAGTGATVGKWNGLQFAMKGGVGSSSIFVDKIVVAALAVVNAVGDVIDDRGQLIAGAHKDGKFLDKNGKLNSFLDEKLLSRNINTTLVVVATNARFSKVDVNRIAQRSHDGLSRAIVPSHTTFDGDVSFALSCGDIKAPVDLVAEMGAQMTSEAIRSAVRNAKTVAGVRGLAL
jgi:L-aminopeptidase/D-esterase-like protein